MAMALKKLEYIKFAIGMVERSGSGRIGLRARRSATSRMPVVMTKSTREVIVTGCIQGSTFPPRLIPRMRQDTAIVRHTEPATSKLLNASNNVLPSDLARLGPMSLGVVKKARTK